ncbi:MJ1255/VC2487 family glycosyltransferase [Planctomycetota bacterium]
MPKKILYGVQATGNGHINRSREIVKALKQAGHEVHVIFSGRRKEDLWGVEAFEPYTVFRGMTFVVKQGKVKTFQTLRQLKLGRLSRDVKSFDAAGFELVLVDFEPVAARIARRNRIPAIGLSHQCSFVHPIAAPRGGVGDRIVLKRFAPVNTAIGFHWHHFEQPILPPVMPDKFAADPVIEADKIMVYMPWETPADIQAAVQGFADHQFYIYGKFVDAPHEEGHLHFRPPSREGFLADLQSSAGVIANAGFQLGSEALYLGKKLLVKPVAGQFEQESNVAVLESLSLGRGMATLDPDTMAAWLDADPPARQHYPDVSRAIAEWIGGGDYSDPTGFTRSVWAAMAESGS